MQVSPKRLVVNKVDFCEHTNRVYTTIHVFYFTALLYEDPK